MKELNIPIYRAKKIDSDEYVIGYYTERVSHYPSSRHYIHFHNGSTDIHKIDPTTLAIHFPGIIDSQGNKIFASLQEDGKGGDITLTKDGYKLYKRVHLFFKDGYSGSIDIEIVETLLKRSSFVSDIKILDIKK